MEFNKIWAIILRRRWLCFTNFIVFFGLVVFLSHVLSPVYKGKTLIWVDTAATTSALMTMIGVQTSAQATNSNATSEDYKFYTEISLGTVRPILSKVVKALDLKDSKGEPLDPDKLVESKYTYYISSFPHVKISQYEDAGILEINGYSHDPRKAAQISNEVANLYIEEMRKRTVEEYKSTHPSIQIQIDNIKKEYNRNLEELKDFMNREKTYDLSMESQAIETKIYSAKSEYDDNEKAILGLQKTLAESEKKMKGLGIFRESNRGISRSDQLNTLQTNLNTLLLSITDKSIDFTKEHPDVRRIEAQIEASRKLISKAAEFYLSSKTYSVDPAYDSLYTGMFTNSINLEVAIAKRKLLKWYIGAYQSELMTLPKKNAESQKINLELSAMKDTYSMLLKYIYDVDIAEALVLSNLKIVEPSITPKKPSFPNKTLNYALGFIIAIFWSILVALFMEYIDYSIKTVDDLKRNCNLVFLGTVPKSRKLKNESLITKLPSNGIMVEAIRTIKNNIKYAYIDKPLKTMLITSSISGEGKSTLAAMLSFTMSKEYKKMLLLDLDLRKPILHRIFNLSNKIGVTNVITGNKTIEEVVSKTGIENLDIITSGPIPIDPGNLTESNKMKEFISSLKEQYDLIIIDSPPALAVHDPVVLGTLVDGIIYVVESSKISAAMINHVTDLFNKANVNIIGVIMNKVKSPGMGHYQGYYHSYYDSYNHRE